MTKKGEIFVKDVAIKTMTKDGIGGALTNNTGVENASP